MNSQGQTFAMIEGPVEFRMGSPPTEPDRLSGNEIPHHRIIPRRFAIAVQEVSVEQYQGFVKDETPEFGSRRELDKYSPDQKGPHGTGSPGITPLPTATGSVARRASRRTGCYEPNPDGGYAAGMKIKPDALHTGYRLPTAAEWEYACRAGAVTSRYYGRGVDLLGRVRLVSCQRHRTTPGPAEACCPTSWAVRHAGKHVRMVSGCTRILPDHDRNRSI